MLNIKIIYEEPSRVASSAYVRRDHHSNRLQHPYFGMKKGKSSEVSIYRLMRKYDLVIIKVANYPNDVFMLIEMDNRAADYRGGATTLVPVVFLWVWKQEGAAFLHDFIIAPR